MQIRTSNLWILRFAQYDKARCNDKDFVSMTRVLRYFTLLRKVQYDKHSKHLPTTHKPIFQGLRTICRHFMMTADFVILTRQVSMTNKCLSF